MCVVLALVLALTACGGKNDNGGTASSAGNASGQSNSASAADNGGNTVSAGNQAPAAAADKCKIAQIRLTSPSNIEVTIESDYLTKLDAIEAGDGGFRMKNGFVIGGSTADYSGNFNFSIDSMGYNLGAWPEEIYSNGNYELDGNKVTINASLLGIADLMKQYTSFYIMYDEYPETDGGETKTTDLGNYTYDQIVTEDLQSASLSISYPLENRVKIDVAMNDGVRNALEAEYGSLSIQLFEDAKTLNGYRPSIDFYTNVSEYEGRTEYYGSMSLFKYRQIDEWSYESEWIEWGDDAPDVGVKVNDEKFSFVAVGERVQDLVSGCTVYKVTNSMGEAIEVGYLKDVYKKDAYDPFPAEFVMEKDADYGFAPHSDSFRIVDFTYEQPVPVMKWSEIYSGRYGYGCIDGEMKNCDVRVTVFWNNDETGYTDMYTRVTFPTEQDYLDWRVGNGAALVVTDGEPDDSLITAEAYEDYFDRIGPDYAFGQFVGREGNTVYYYNDRHWDTESLFEYGDHMEVLCLDLWEDVDYKTKENFVQNKVISFFDTTSYDYVERNAEVTSYSSY